MDDGFAESRDDNGVIVGFDWTLFSQNRDRLMAVLGWWRMSNDDRIDLGSVAWTLAEDYEVKYWKRLPNVHVVTFQTLSAPPPTPIWTRQAAWYSNWWSGKFEWYRRPWEMEGWPPQRQP
jgi:hypothetical protein